MNLWFWPFATGTGSEVSYVAGAPLLDNLGRFLAFSLVTSLGWDIGRAITTAVLVVLVGTAILGALRRAARRATFASAAEAPVSRTASRR
jgi:energy-coupling factor transport system substrate-specific component